MKSLFQLLFLGIICLSFAAGQTDSSKSVENPKKNNYEVMASGGVSLPYLPTYFRNNWKSAWSAGIGYGISFTPGDMGYVTLYQTIDYSQMKFKQVNSDNQQYSNFQTIHITDFMLSLKGNFTPKIIPVQPYFLLGIGAMNYIGDVNVIEDSKSIIKYEHQLALAWTFGLGLEVPVTNRIGVFVEGKSTLGVIVPTRQIFPIHGGVHLRF